MNDIMKIRDLLTLIFIAVTIIIVVIGGIYAIITKTKRFDYLNSVK